MITQQEIFTPKLHNNLYTHQKLSHPAYYYFHKLTQKQMTYHKL